MTKKLGIGVVPYKITDRPHLIEVKSRYLIFIQV